jgi:hypothetical protein
MLRNRVSPFPIRKSPSPAPYSEFAYKLAAYPLIPVPTQQRSFPL